MDLRCELWVFSMISAFMPILLFLSSPASATAAPPVVAFQGIPSPIRSLDPFSIAGIDAYTVTGLVLEPLARSNPYTGEISPVLAKSWVLDPANKAFRVKLREGVKFHDGAGLSAQDVQFTFEAYFKPGYRADLWRGMWTAIDSVRALDERTVEFKMKEWNYQSFESALTSLRVLPKSFYDPVDRQEFRKRIVGTGPFRFKSFGNQLELEPNPDWWGSPRPRHNLVFKIVASARLAAEMMAKGELDFYAIGNEGIPASKFVRKFKLGLGHGFWLDLNMANPLFKHAEAREVLSLIWRREDLNRKVFAAEMKPALDMFSPATDVYPLGEPMKADGKAARALLKSKSWEDGNKNGVVEKNGLEFDFTVLVRSPEQERWVTLFQNEAKEMGIAVRVYKVEDDDQWLRRLKEGRFDAAAGGGGLINEVTSLAWHSKGPYNYQKFSDPEIDRMTERLEKEFDLRNRRLILRKAIARIRELRPQVPGLFSETEVFLISPRLVVNEKSPATAAAWQLH